MTMRDTIVLCGIIGLLVLCAAVLCVAVLCALLGYEDEDGLHHGEEP